MYCVDNGRPNRAVQTVLVVHLSRVPGSGVRGRGSGERETTASSLAGKEESSRKEDNSGQGKDGPCWSYCARGEWTVTWTSYGRH